MSLYSGSETPQPTSAPGVGADDPDAAQALAATMPTTTTTQTAEAGRLDQDGEVHFWFPVTVEVVGAADSQTVDRVVARVFQELNDELERQA